MAKLVHSSALVDDGESFNQFVKNEYAHGLL